MGDGFLQVKRPNQQYQSTEGESWKENNTKNIKKTENTHTHTHTRTKYTKNRYTYKHSKSPSLKITTNIIVVVVMFTIQ